MILPYNKLIRVYRIHKSAVFLYPKEERMQIIFDVNNQKLERRDNNFIVADSKNYLYARFNFSADWDGKTKTAIFKQDSAVFHVVLNNNTCLVPHEVLKTGYFNVSVFAGDLITANAVVISVVKSGLVDGATPTPPTPDIYSTIIDTANEAKAIAEAIETKANNGEFDGEKGQDGISPHVGDNGNWWIGDTDTGVSAESNGTNIAIDTDDSISEPSDEKVPSTKTVKIYTDREVKETILYGYTQPITNTTIFIKAMVLGDEQDFPLALLTSGYDRNKLTVWTGNDNGTDYIVAIAVKTTKYKGMSLTRGQVRLWRNDNEVLDELSHRFIQIGYSREVVFSPQNPAQGEPYRYVISGLSYSTDSLSGDLPIQLSASNFVAIDIFGETGYVCEIEGTINILNDYNQRVEINSDRDPDTNESSGNDPTVLEIQDFPITYKEADSIDMGGFYPPAIFLEHEERGTIMIISGVELDQTEGVFNRNSGKSVAICMPDPETVIQSGITITKAVPMGRMPTPSNLREENGMYKADITYPEGVYSTYMRFDVVGLEPMEIIKSEYLLVTGSEAEMNKETLLQDVPPGTYHILCYVLRLVTADKYYDYSYAHFNSVYATVTVDNREKLAAPTASYDGTYITWDTVPNADMYWIKKDGQVYAYQNSTSWEVRDYGGQGMYGVYTIVANDSTGVYADSLPSNSIAIGV